MSDVAIMQQHDTMIQVCDLASVRGERTLFESINFSLVSGEVLFVEGRNGSGKTTLLRMLCGLGTPQQGEVLWRGRAIGDLAQAYHREVIYIGHRPGIKEELSAIENLRMTSAIECHPCSTEQALSALYRIGLDDIEELPCCYLSQGQRRRVAMARLLLTPAIFWVLDEPFVALDEEAVTLLQQLIREHLGKGGIVALTSHQPVGLVGEGCQQLRLGGGCAAA